MKHKMTLEIWLHIVAYMYYNIENWLLVRIKSDPKAKNA